MDKAALRLPSGIEVSFEGDDAFDRLDEFVTKHLPTLVSLSGSASTPAAPARLTSPLGDEGVAVPKAEIDVAMVEGMLEQVGAATDIERVTVMAQASTDLLPAMEGLDYETAKQWYRELGFVPPASWRGTFANARAKGYLQNIGRGLWKTTYAGERFAVHGIRNTPRRRAKRAPRKAADEV